MSTKSVCPQSVLKIQFIHKVTIQTIRESCFVHTKHNVSIPLTQPAITKCNFHTLSIQNHCNISSPHNLSTRNHRKMSPEHTKREETISQRVYEMVWSKQTSPGKLGEVTKCILFVTMPFKANKAESMFLFHSYFHGRTRQNWVWTNCV